ncbi:chloramphenicol acetyltransferase [Flavobacterium sp. 83]|uniref:chloramphenicol acetyltransferase n=1 Tax=Flavobacterium sp. 83 TaxID=1131812 RepID=UPI00054FA141|nr:chloramphenicol acetyltransferase [Flavobacterium sp. 83]
MKTLLDIENWNRKEHFLFFKQMEEPFFGATVNIDCTKAYETAKALNASFFIYYLHKTLVAVNTIETFRYRISDDKIFVYDQINGSATIGREDGTFGFSLIEYNADFTVFKKTAITEIERIQNTTGLFTRTFENDNVIHFSAIPWLNFSSLSHARSYTFPDSCPKISFGKMMVAENGKRTMSMSIHVHHGLMDGLHVGQFVDYFQELMNH